VVDCHRNAALKDADFVGEDVEDRPRRRVWHAVPIDADGLIIPSCAGRRSRRNIAYRAHSARLAKDTFSSAKASLTGILAGYFRRLDGPIMRIIDAFMALPDILLAIFLVAVLGASATNVILALAIVYTPRVARVVRASTLVVRELPFVEAARALGVSTWRIMSVHVLLNVASPVLVQATFIFAYAVLAEAGLSFLGTGVPQEVPTWGTMIAASQSFSDQAIWLVVFPGLAIVLAALSLQLVGDGLRDMLDPKLRKSL
jgi:ABC-type dipeptide/oligopeptide/nickel transport systems, permease components